MELAAGRKKRIKKIPDSFIFEMMDGKPLYYKGYKRAIKNNQNAESIRGTSSLQASVLSHILSLLFKNVYLAEHHILTGNPGISLNCKDNLTGHILIYDKQILPGFKISKHYLDVPALLQIEVDIRAEMEDMTETGYIKRKHKSCLTLALTKLFGFSPAHNKY